MFSQNDFLETQIKDKTNKQIFVITYNQNLMGIISWPMIQFTRLSFNVSLGPMSVWNRTHVCLQTKKVPDILVLAKLTYTPEDVKYG